MTQLLTVLRDWTNGLALAEIIDVYNLSKAFDYVPHVRLLVSLKNMESKGTFWDG